jgi:hypothetical protein
LIALEFKLQLAEVKPMLELQSPFSAGLGKRAGGGLNRDRIDAGTRMKDHRQLTTTMIFPHRNGTIPCEFA